MKEKVKNFIKENWFKIITILFLLSLGVGLFYWYEWRPTQIRKDCAKQIIELGKGKNLSAYELSTALDYCLTIKGLKK